MSTYALQMLVNAVPGATGAVPYWNASTRLWNTLAMGSALNVLRVNAGGTALEFAAPSGGSAQWESTGGYFRAKPAELATGDYILLTSKVANSGSNVAFVFDTDTTLSGSTRLATFKNNTSERLYIDDEGNIRFGTGMAENTYRSILQTDSLVGLYVGNAGGQTYISLVNNFTGGHNLYLNRSGYGYNGFGSPYAYTGSIELGGIGALASLDGQADGTPHGGISFGDSGFKKSAATDGVMSAQYDGVPVWLWGDKVNTTNAAGTTLWSTTIENNTVHGFEVTIVARRTDSDGRWYGSRRGVFYRAGGGATQEGTTEVVGTDVANGITPGLIDFDTSSNDVRVRVQGEVSKNISWRCYVRKIHMN